jgi:hypothetical protein
MKRILLILLTLASAAHARLGWTLDQCRQKYGYEELMNQGLDGPVYTFYTTYFRIVAFMLDGKVKAIQYWARPNIAVDDGNYFKFYTKAAIDDIIHKNIGDQKLIPAGAGTYLTKEVGGIDIYLSPASGNINNDNEPYIEIDLPSDKAPALEFGENQQKAMPTLEEITGAL